VAVGRYHESTVRRADRLFQIIQRLRGRRRAVTAAQLAEDLGVSDRTIYRDIRDLVASGTPIEGEAGVGYALKREYDLPPLMFDPDELEALALGARIASSFGDEGLARAAESALSKIESILPPRLRRTLAAAPLYAPRTGAGRSSSYALTVARAALAERRRLLIHYRKEDGAETERVVRPLAAFFWGHSWTLAAWCELRQDFRMFRLDRMRRIEPGEAFEEEPGRGLRDYLRTIGPYAERLLD
jgi:predicted DNA-binding transcriptional regulator YafY